MSTEVAGRRRELWDDPMVRYAGLLFVYLAVIGVVLGWLEPALRPAYAQMSRATAGVVHAVMALFSTQVYGAGDIVRFGAFSVQVIGECLGVFEMMIFAACVFAFPSGWQGKAWGLLIGPVVIYGLNVLRIVTLLVIGRYHPDAFDFLHVYFWQATLIGMVVVTWLGWLALFARRWPR